MPPVNPLQQAKIFIRAGRLPEARKLLRRVVAQDPQNYVAWLLLARAASSKRAALGYVRQAQAIRPDSQLVSKELRRLDQQKDITYQPSRLQSYLFFGSALIVLLILIVWLAPLGLQHVAALRDMETAPTPVQMVITPLAVSSQIEATPEPQPTLLPTPTARPLHRQKNSEVPPPEMLASVRDNKATQGSVQDEEELPLEVQPPSEVQDEPLEINEQPAAPNSIRPNGVGPAERWIDVNLTQQTLVAYEGDAPIFNSLISSGMWDTPTVVGQFRTVMKYESQDMNGYLLGYDYFLEDVPYVMYFFEDYAIHGAYWHNNFGTPMSHGCVNMNPADAGWLFNWAPVGTTVSIHH